MTLDRPCMQGPVSSTSRTGLLPGSRATAGRQSFPYSCPSFSCHLRPLASRPARDQDLGRNMTGRNIKSACSTRRPPRCGARRLGCRPPAALKIHARPMANPRANRTPVAEFAIIQPSLPVGRLNFRKFSYNGALTCLLAPLNTADLVLPGHQPETRRLSGRDSSCWPDRVDFSDTGSSGGFDSKWVYSERVNG